MSNFITEIKIKKVRHLENIDIKLGNEKKHLILTGKNGCGKTSVLEEMDIFLKNRIDGSLVPMLKKIKYIRNEVTSLLYSDMKKNMLQIRNLNRQKKDLLEQVESNLGILLTLKHRDKIYPFNSDFIYAFFKAKRTINNIDKSTSIEKVVFPKEKTARLNKLFIKYLVGLKVERSFAKDDNELELVAKIDSWFNKFEDMLKQIFNDDSLALKFDRQLLNYNFRIEREGREAFDFYTLSDGYSAIIDIVTELILKIETTESKSFDCEGIVLIDEIETHLHVELQKNILPLLTTFFPNIQFIVTTHSPFVLQSIENSVVYDLERKEQLSGEKLKNASYSDIVKNYFEVDSEFSKVLENDIVRYENLVQIFDEKKLNIEDEKELLELDIKLDKITPMLSDTIYLRFKESQDRISDNG